MLTTYIIPEGDLALPLRQPRIELGAQRWQRWILPLNHWHLFLCEWGSKQCFTHHRPHTSLHPDNATGQLRPSGKNTLEETTLSSSSANGFWSVTKRVESAHHKKSDFLLWPHISHNRSWSWSWSVKCGQWSESMSFVIVIYTPSASVVGVTSHHKQAFLRWLYRIVLVTQMSCEHTTASASAVTVTWLTQRGLIVLMWHTVCIHKNWGVWHRHHPWWCSNS